TSRSNVTVTLVTMDRCVRFVCPALTVTDCTAGCVAACTSQAPMSAAAPTPRANPVPRWSVVRLAGLEPALISGLPVRIGMVCVAAGCADARAVLESRRARDIAEVQATDAAAAATADRGGGGVAGDGAVANHKPAGAYGPVEVDAAGRAVRGRIAGDCAVLQE